MVTEVVWTYHCFWVSSYCIGWPTSPGDLSDTKLITSNLPPPFEIPVIVFPELESFSVEDNLIWLPVNPVVVT